MYLPQMPTASPDLSVAHALLHACASFPNVFSKTLAATATPLGGISDTSGGYFRLHIFHNLSLCSPPLT